MINYVSGSVFNSTADAVIVPINLVGVAGAGLALAFKKARPYWYLSYKLWCDKDEEWCHMGQIHTFGGGTSQWILGFPTKTHWKNKSKVEYIEKGLKSLVSTLRILNIKSVAIPKIGCGHGGLDWETDVKPLIEKYLNDVPTRCDVYVEWIR